MFLKILITQNADLEERTIALKSRKDGRVVVKEVIRASVNSKSVWIKDVAFSYMGGWCVDWSPEKVGQKHNWSYEGKWGREKYSLTNNNWKIACPTLNEKAVLAHPRFKYSGYNPMCGWTIAYLKRYVDNPKLELLSKLGLGRLSNRDKFVERLGKNKAMINFLIQHRAEIEARTCGVDIIQMAFKKGITLTEAQRRIENRRLLKSLGMPEGVDHDKVRAYLDRTELTWTQYSMYLSACQQLGMDLNDTKVSFPMDFNARWVVIHDMQMEQKRQKDKALAKSQDGGIRKVINKFKSLEKIREDGLMIVLPRKTEDLVQEGKWLVNCLGDGHYAGKMARGETLIAFIRLVKTVPYVAVEYDIQTKRICQCYAAKNQRPPDVVTKFVERAFQTAA